MANNIKITRFAALHGTSGEHNQHAWPLKVIAESPGGDPRVFVFQRITGPLDPEQGDVFRAVASAHDMFELPGQPTGTDNGEQLPYYRSASVTLLFRTPGEVEDAWGKVVEDVNELCKNLELENELKAVSVVSLDGDEINQQDLTSVQNTLLKLSFHPAGTADVVDDEQVITDPDDTVRGWLPVSEVPAAFKDPVPGGALFFYNMEAHPEVKAHFPPETPFSQHYLFFSGLKMAYDTQYVITRDTVYWMNFDPLQDADWANMKAPWPVDYVDADNPGTNVPEIELSLFET